jgi:hypothetical protein
MFGNSDLFGVFLGDCEAELALCSAALATDCASDNSGASSFGIDAHSFGGKIDESLWTTTRC